MSYPRISLRLMVAAALLLTAGIAQNKRPLTHQDYDGWRSIVGQKLSNDGKYLAYGQFPEEGDGEVVIRNLTTGKEQREPAGARPAPVPPTPGEEGPASEARGLSLAFSSDNKTLVFSTFPTKSATSQAKKDKKPAPKDGMVILDLASGKATRIERVKRFALAEKAPGLLAYLKEGPDGSASRGESPNATQGNDQQGGRGGRGGAAAGGSGRGMRPEFGSDLVLRTLADGSRAHLPRRHRVRRSPTMGGKSFSRSARAIRRRTASSRQSPAMPRLRPRCWRARASTPSSPGTRTRRSWCSSATATMPRPNSRSGSCIAGTARRAAAELAGADTAGFRKEFVVSDRGTLASRRTGRASSSRWRRPQPEKKDASDAADDDEKAVVDLWSYKDDYVQPMQKVRAERDRNRTYTAVYLIPEKKVVQLADSGACRRHACRKARNSCWAPTTALPARWPITTSATPMPI